MSETGLTLFIDLPRGERIDLSAAAYASLAWSDLIKSVGMQIDPFAEWHVELESSMPGSLKIRTILGISSDAEMKALIKGAILTSLIFLGQGVASWEEGHILDQLAGTDAPTQAQVLSPKERHELARDISKMILSDAGRTRPNRVYEALNRDEKVRGAGVTSNPTKRPNVMVPRSQFPLMISSPATIDHERRTITDRTELVLIRPVLTSDASRRWQFLSPYGTFGAQIHDQAFLDALSDGKINVPLAQGIRMVVEMSITEEREGQLWRPVERVITRVVRIVPAPRQQRLDLEGPQ